MEVAAVGAARWAVGKALSPVGLLESWAASSALGPNVHALKRELLCAQGILNGAHGWDVSNPALAELLLELRQLAYGADDVLDELDYFRIQDELDGTYETTDAQERGLISGLALNARHTAKSVAGKLMCSCAALSRRADSRGEQEEANQGCLSSAAHAAGKRLSRCSLPSVEDDASTGRLVNGQRFLCGAWPSKAQPRKDTTYAPKLKFDRVEMSKRMADIIDQLKPVCANVATILNIEFQKLGQLGTTSTTIERNAFDRPKTTPQIIEPKLYGRDRQKEELVHNITCCADHLTVFSVHGPGGIGKTTFAQHIYEEVKNHFQVPIWICVSFSFNASRLLQDIVKYIPKGDNESGSARDEDLIEKVLQSKRFLLVLDDVWTYHEDEWKKLLAPFQKGGTKGNIVIVTTRIPEVARMVGTRNCSVKLERLEPKEFMHLFQECVFDDQLSWEAHPELHQVGKQIVDMLKGFPLAAKTVGRLLRNYLTLDHWMRVLESKEWELQTGGDDIMPALKLSYHFLSFPLQQCFSHCALFPEDYAFQKEELIHLWIGLGLLDTSDQHKRAEYIGMSYFDDLVNHGFLEVKKQSASPSFVMHDLLRELSVTVSSYECLSINSSNVRSIKIPISVRHLSIHIDEADVKDRMTFEKIKRDMTTLGTRLKTENLRTLMLFGYYQESFVKIFGDLFIGAKSLRVIFLSEVSYSVEDLLHNFSKLVHLRYLRIGNGRYDSSTILPGSISRFYHLMVLDVQHNNAQLDFVRHMSNLLKLRHFLVPEDKFSFYSEISEVGKLKSLQELRRFEVKSETNGFELRQLSELLELRGSLGIYNLEKIEETNEVDCSILSNMKHLHRIKLDWDINRSIRDPEVEGHVLESLRPHSNLQELCIAGHGGATCPNWLGVDLTIKNLESLNLESVTWNILPLPGKLCMVNRPYGECPGCVTDQGFQNMKSLVLVNIPKLEKWQGNGIYHLLPRLQKLKVRGCSELTELPLPNFSSAQPEENMTCFPELQRIQISDCPKLSQLPPIPWTLSLCFVDIQRVASGYDQLSYSKNQESKSSLTIRGKGALDSAFWNVLAFNNLSGLERLSISDCPPVPVVHLHMLPRLKSLTIQRLSNLLCSVEEESHLHYDLPVEFLSIYGCDASGKELTQVLSNFTNLSTLDIWNCKNLTGLSVGEKQVTATAVPSPSAAQIKHQHEEKTEGGEEEAEAAADQGLLILPPQIESLRISLCPEMSLLKYTRNGGTSSVGRGLQGLRSLRFLIIASCPKFLSSNMSSSSCSLFPTSLQELYLQGVEGMGTLEPLPHFTDLETNFGDPRGEDLCHLLTHGALTEVMVTRTPNFFYGPDLSGVDEQDLINSCRLMRLITDDIAGVLAEPICRLLSSSLTNFSLYEVERLTKEQEEALQMLTSLQSLSIAYCKKLQSLPTGLTELPSLKVLWIMNCPAIQSLDGLPNRLQELNIYNCPAIQSLDGLPDSLKKLNIDDCPAIQSLNGLPDSLKKLDINKCPAIQSLDGLPDSLQELDINECPAIQSLDGLPKSLQELRIVNCPAIRSLPKGSLPSSLRILMVDRGSKELVKLCQKLRGTIPIIYA